MHADERRGGACPATPLATCHSPLPKAANDAFTTTIRPFDSLRSLRAGEHDARKRRTPGLPQRHDDTTDGNDGRRVRHNDTTLRLAPLPQGRPAQLAQGRRAQRTATANVGLGGREPEVRAERGSGSCTRNPALSPQRYNDTTLRLTSLPQGRRAQRTETPSSPAVTGRHNNSPGRKSGVPARPPLSRRRRRHSLPPDGSPGVPVRRSVPPCRHFDVPPRRDCARPFIACRRPRRSPSPGSGPDGLAQTPARKTREGRKKLAPTGSGPTNDPTTSRGLHNPSANKTSQPPRMAAHHKPLLRVVPPLRDRDRRFPERSSACTHPRRCAPTFAIKCVPHPEQTTQRPAIAQRTADEQVRPPRRPSPPRPVESTTHPPPHVRLAGPGSALRRLNEKAWQRKGVDVPGCPMPLSLPRTPLS